MQPVKHKEINQDSIRASHQMFAVCVGLTLYRGNFHMGTYFPAGGMLDARRMCQGERFACGMAGSSASHHATSAFQL